MKETNLNEKAEGAETLEELDAIPKGEMTLAQAERWRTLKSGSETEWPADNDRAKDWTQRRSLERCLVDDEYRRANADWFRAARQELKDRETQKAQAAELEERKRAVITRAILERKTREAAEQKERADEAAKKRAAWEATKAEMKRTFRERPITEPGGGEQ
jgi:hypothetical protein